MTSFRPLVAAPSNGALCDCTARLASRVASCATAVRLIWARRERRSSSSVRRSCRRRLQRAQLASDVAALDRLIDDRLVFTGPDGKLYSKQDDPHVHRSGQQSMMRVDEEDLAALIVRGTGVTWFLGTLEGTLAGEPFLARVRYTRTWDHDDDLGWRLIAAHVSPADGTCRRGFTVG
jgi:uncharacterized protein DUF4440